MFGKIGRGRKERIYADYLYSAIPFTEYESLIINSPVMRRLMNVRQNSTAYFVFPQLNYTRFVHSLGVMHLNSISFRQVILNSDKEDVKKFLSIFHEEFAGFLKKNGGSIIERLVPVMEKKFQKMGYGKGLQETYGDSNNNYKEYLKTYFEEFREKFEQSKIMLSDRVLLNFSLDVSSMVNGDRKIYNFSYLLVLQLLRYMGLLHDIGHPHFSHILEKYWGDHEIIGIELLVNAVLTIIVFAMVREMTLQNNKIVINDEFFLNYVILYFLAMLQVGRVEWTKIERYEAVKKIIDEFLGEQNKQKQSGIDGLEKALRKFQKQVEEKVNNSKKEYEVIINLKNKIIADGQIGERVLKLFGTLYDLMNGVVGTDRIDYLLRDSFGFGGSINLNWRRILTNFVLVKNKKEMDKFEIIPRLRVTREIETLLFGRYQIYRYIVNHHNVLKKNFLISVVEGFRWRTDEQRKKEFKSQLKLEKEINDQYEFESEMTKIGSITDDWLIGKHAEYFGKSIFASENNLKKEHFAMMKKYFHELFWGNKVYKAIWRSMGDFIFFINSNSGYNKKRAFVEEYSELLKSLGHDYYELNYWNVNEIFFIMRTDNPFIGLIDISQTDFVGYNVHQQLQDKIIQRIKNSRFINEASVLFVRTALHEKSDFDTIHGVDSWFYSLYVKLFNKLFNMVPQEQWKTMDTLEDKIFKQIWLYNNGYFHFSDFLLYDENSGEPIPIAFDSSFSNILQIDYSYALFPPIIVYKDINLSDDDYSELKQNLSDAILDSYIETIKDLRSSEKRLEEDD